MTYVELYKKRKEIEIFIFLFVLFLMENAVGKAF